uniref:Uncharacterized protein LOC100176798 n=1 Tax=Phallusia mammillata TaxID=59560 RepID=A0A6F9DFU8_9ASCI|nr:uncharacterized protein LOC100176798 [Phallusia mammillata]
MDKTILIKDVIIPFKRTARMVDKKLLEFESSDKSHHGNGGSFPYESWSRLQDMKTDVIALHEICNHDTSTVKKQTEIVSQHNEASLQCLKLIDSQLSLLEDHLSGTGFVPGGQLQRITPESEKSETRILSDCSNRQCLESKIPYPKPTKKVEAVNQEVSPPKTDVDAKEITSPQLPVFTLAAKRSEVLGTPTAPKFQSSNSVVSGQASAYFNKLSSPDIRFKDDNSNTPVPTSTSKVFFPVLTTPKTPELNCEISKEYVRPQPPVYMGKQNTDNIESDDEQLVMHSKNSELNKFYQDGKVGGSSQCTVHLILYMFTIASNKDELKEGPPDITLTQLKMKKPIEPQDMASPATPDLQNFGITAMKTSTQLPRFKDYGESPDLLHSPVQPNILRDPNYRSPPKRRSSFWVSNDEYEGLPSDMKRLFTIEQANSALYAMKMELASSSKSGLTLADIERATGLGGKTQSFILMLTTVGAVVKVPGTNLYHVNE